MSQLHCSVAGFPNLENLHDFPIIMILRISYIVNIIYRIVPIILHITHIKVHTLLTILNNKNHYLPKLTYRVIRNSN